MRPINLIPKEERRATAGNSRTGPLAYIVVGVLAVLLAGVVMLVLTNNEISDREAEVTTLEDERDTARAEAEELAPYASFQQVAEQRTQTVTSLADSRFDWERVIRQLSLILPSDIYLSSLTGSAGAGTAEGSIGVAGPSLTLAGCTTSQDMVAVLVAALKEIDGVTRVGLGSSVIVEGGGGATTGDICATPGMTLFEIVVAFDAAPPSPNGDGATLPGEEEAEADEDEEGESESGEGEAEGDAGASASTAPGATG